MSNVFVAKQTLDIGRWTLDTPQTGVKRYKFARMKSVIMVRMCFTNAGSVTP